MNTINKDSNCKKCLCNSCVKPKVQCQECEKCLSFNHEKRIVLSCEDYVKDSDQTKKLSFDRRIDEMARSITKNSVQSINEHNSDLRNQLKECDILLCNIENVFNSGNISDTDSEFNSYQNTRIDEIDNAIYQALTIITCNENLKWDMELIGPIADMIVRFLCKKGYIIYYPTLVEQEDESEAIFNFFSP